MGKKLKGRWLDEPSEDDYAAAESFLTLIYDEKSTASFVKKLKRAEVLQFEAKDIFRASGLPLLGINNSHVKADQKKLVAGKRLSPSPSLIGRCANRSPELSSKTLAASDLELPISVC